MSNSFVTLASLGELDPDLHGRPVIRWDDLPSRVIPHATRKYQRILLMNPAATLYCGDLPRCTYPLGIGYLAAVLERHGYDVRLLDVFAEGYDNVWEVDGDPNFLRYGLSNDEIAEVIRDFAPDVAGISSIFSNQADNVHNLVRIARQVMPQCKTVLGGAHARYFPSACLADNRLDAVILGEGELTFLIWLEYLNETLQEGDLQGIAYRTLNGDVRIRAELPLINARREPGRSVVRESPVQGAAGELDHIPYPAWHLYNMERYFQLRAYQSPYTVGSRVGQIYTSRGCTAHCTFCTTTNFWGQRLRRRSVGNVIGEIVALREQYGIDEFHVQDDNITNDMEHARDLFRAFQEVGLPWATPQGTALWRMDAELLDLMAASGAYQITFAIESGVQRVLRELIRKPLDLRRTSHLIKYARSLGMHVHGFFIIGMPPMFGNAGESFDEMRVTYDYAKEAGFDSASFFAASPIIGSQLLSECLRQGFVDPSVALYRMSYKQGLISVPGLWSGAEVADTAAQFNADFNKSRPRTYAAQREWNAGQY